MPTNRSNSKWKETKRECEVDSEGNYITKKVTFESAKKTYFGLEKKDLLDLCLKVLGLAAIFTPLLLFYLTQNAELKRRKFSVQFDTYAVAADELQKLLTKEPDDVSYTSLKEKILYQITPKIYSLGDKQVIDTFEMVRNKIIQYDSLYKRFRLIDSLKYYMIEAFFSSGSFHELQIDNPLNRSFIKYARQSNSLAWSAIRDLKSNNIKLSAGIDPSYDFSTSADTIMARINDFRSSFDMAPYVLLMQSSGSDTIHDSQKYTRFKKNNKLKYSFYVLEHSYAELISKQKENLNTLIRDFSIQMVNANSILLKEQ